MLISVKMSSDASDERVRVPGMISMESSETSAGDHDHDTEDRVKSLKLNVPLKISVDDGSRLKQKSGLLSPCSKFGR